MAEINNLTPAVREKDRATEVGRRWISGNLKASF